MIGIYLVAIMSISTILLFQTQSMIHVVAVFIALIWMKKKYSNVELKKIKKERIDWIATQYYYVFVKIWYTLLIRLWGIKLYKVVKFVWFVLQGLRKWIKASNEVWKKHYIDNIRKNIVETLKRQENQVKNLTLLFSRKRRNKRKLLLEVEVKKDNRKEERWDWNALSEKGE